jgi:excisionase family DNA binding protein
MKLTANERNSMSLMETDSVLTTDQAIEYLKISRPTFLKYVRLGRIRAVKAGKGWRVLRSELYRFLRGKTDIGNISLEPTA